MPNEYDLRVLSFFLEDNWSLFVAFLAEHDLSEKDAEALLRFLAQRGHTC